MFRATLRSLLARKLRLILSGVAIILGVAFVAGSFILTDTIGNVFDNLFGKVNANVDVVVRGVESKVSSTHEPVPASVLPTVRKLPQVQDAEPVIQGYAQLVDKKGKTYPYHPGPPALGGNFNGGKAVSTIDVVSGHAPRNDREIVIDTTTAKKTHFQVGDVATVLTRLPAAKYRIVGLFTNGGQANTTGASVTLFTDAQAQRVLGRPGEYDALEIAAAPGVPTDEVLASVRSVLPSGVEAVTGQQEASDQANDIKDGLSFFRTFLLIFGGVALFVGAFIIFNTFSMLIGQRMRELAMYRAIGASRAQVTRSVLGESLIVGFVATSIGIGLGVLVAVGLRALIEALVGGSLPHGGLVFAAHTFIYSYLVGVIVTTLAALVPARRASRVPPMAAIRDAALPESSRWRAITIGGVLLVAGVAALVPGLSGNLPLLGVGAVAVFLGVAALSSLVVPLVVPAISAPFGERVPGRLGRRNALRNPRRTSTTAGALMIGVSLVAAVLVLGSSVKTSIHGVINRAFAADFDVEDKNFQGLTPAIGHELAQQPDIAQANALGFADALIDNHKSSVTALPGEAIDVTVKLAPKAGSMTLRPGSILIDKKHADDNNWTVGDKLRVQYERGPVHALTISGIYADNALVGGYLVDQSERRWFPDRLDGVVVIKAASGASLDEVRATIDRIVKPYPNAKVQTRQEFIDAQAQQVNILLAVISGLLVLSIIIAIIGIVNSLALSVIERTRELGLLRAVGLSRRQLRRMIRVEAVVVAVFGGLLGLAVGSGLGIAIVKALGSEGIDTLSYPWMLMVLIVIAAALAGLVAAIFPAWRASKLNVLDAIATE